MADYVELNSGSGGAKMAADEISTLHHQRVKLQHGADGSATDVSTASPLPVQVHDGTTGVSVTAGGAVYTNIRNAAGTEMGTTSSPLQVQIGDGTDQATVDSSGNLNVVLAEGIADDAAFTPGTSKVVPVGATFDDTTPDSVNEGDIGAIRMSANRNAYTTIRDAAGNERGANVNASNELSVAVGSIAAGDNNIGNVDVASALPAGDNNIGNVDIASAIPAGDNNIGNVDIVTLPDEGQQNMAGSISVAIASDQSAVSVSPDTTLTDDAAFTPGTSKVSPIGATFDDTTPDSVDEGDIGAVRMSANRNVYTTIRDAAGNERGVNVDASNQLAVSAAQATHDSLNCNATLQVGDTDVANGNPVPVSDAGSTISVDDGGGALTVDGTVTANAGTGNFGTNLAQVGGASVQTGGGTETGCQRVTLANDSTGVLSVDDNGATLSVDDGGGALTVDGTVTVTQSQHSNLQCNATIQLNDTDVSNSNPVPVVGNVASGSAAAGNPVQVSGRAAITNPTAVSDGNVVRIQCDDEGRVIVATSPRDLSAHGTQSITGTSQTQIVGAAGAGVFLDLCDLIVANSSATLVTVEIKDDTSGGTTRHTVVCAADGGGQVINFDPPLTASTANKGWSATVSSAVSTVYVTMNCVKRV